MAVNGAVHSAPPPEMERTPANCRAREMLVRVADKWSMYIIHVLAEAGPLRFSELRRRVDGVSQRMLTVTLRGLERDGGLHPLQEAFIRHGAVQCGFCTPGMLLTTLAFLEREPRPDREAIRAALEGNLCRCTGYTKIVDAVEAYVRAHE